MEARRNAEKNMSGDAVAFHLNPRHPFRELQYTGGSGSKAPGKNHARQNREMIKELQKKAKEKAERAAEPKPVFRMKKFAAVESKLGPLLKETQRQEKQHRDFLRKGAGISKRLPQSGEPSPKQSSAPNSIANAVDACANQIEGLRIDDSSRKSSPLTTPRTAIATKKNFVLRNMKSVIESQPPVQETVEEVPITQTMGFGRVPLYIHKRKLELAQKQEQKRLEKEREKLPPGMTLMSEEERQKTVQLLQENQQKLIAELAKMPLTIETPSLMEKHNMINAKIQEVENALKLFNRKKVYITA